MSALPAVVFKATPEDFVVDELDAYAASGTGTHTFVRIRKRGLTTDQAIKRLAGALGVDARACGAAGMKDKDAVTTQRLSLPEVAPEAALALADKWDDLTVLEAARHGNKLKPGHLEGNRFVIRLRGLPEAALEASLTGFQRIGVVGCPNAFGPQRFGRDGDNAERALAAVRGDARFPGDPRDRRFLFSALQSRWFNVLLESRVQDGTWIVPQLGDLLKKHDSGGLFLCEDVEVDRPRAEQKELSPTGPMFGVSMREAGGEVQAREAAILAADGVRIEHLAPHKSLGEGTRRSLRLLVDDLAVEVLREDQGGHASPVLQVTMSLTKGAYATTVLGQVVELTRSRAEAEPPAEIVEARD